MRYAPILLSLSLLVAAGALAVNSLIAEDESSEQIIFRAGTQNTFEGSSDNFTGNVHVESLFSPNDSTHFFGAYVTFEPGARSAWHVHPTGQYLLVTAGVGRTVVWGGKVEEIRPGDVVWCPPGVKHWHGAAPDSSMTHIALSEIASGKRLEWLEKVTDEQYNDK